MKDGLLVEESAEVSVQFLWLNKCTNVDQSLIHPTTSLASHVVPLEFFFSGSKIISTLPAALLMPASHLTLVGTIGFPGKHQIALRCMCAVALGSGLCNSCPAFVTSKSLHNS